MTNKNKNESVMHDHDMQSVPLTVTAFTCLWLPYFRLVFAFGPVSLSSAALALRFDFDDIFDGF